jgi:hypothetical protein
MRYKNTICLIIFCSDACLPILQKESHKKLFMLFYRYIQIRWISNPTPMNEYPLSQEQAKGSLPSETTKIVFRTLLTGFFVPIVCGLPELMTVKKQLELRTHTGLLLAHQITSPSAFLSGVTMGWISGGLKTVSYANKEFICNSIAKFHGSHNPNQTDRIVASLIVGGIDAVTTHGPSSMRTLIWTNPDASAALHNMTALERLKNLYKIGFSTRVIKACVNAGCYVAFIPWIEKESKAIFPESLGKPLAILGSGIFSGFICTALDVIGVHIYKEAAFKQGKVIASSFFKVSRGLYQQNGLKIFVSGARWNALVSSLAFGTMASIEHFVESTSFTKIHQESYHFFKRPPATKNGITSKQPEPYDENQDTMSSVKNRRN